MACPVCGSQRFFLKDPEDEYETYPFEYAKDGVVFDDAGPGEVDLEQETAFCDQCAWHGDMKEISPK
jgi:hypothetical protein